MYREDQKTQLNRHEIAQKNMRDMLIRGGIISFVGLILIGFSALLTWVMGDNWGGTGRLLEILGVLMILILWVAVIAIMVAGIMTFVQGILILQGKYAIEVDTVERLELKSEYELRRNPIGRGHHRVLVTNQYIYFAKYGKLKSKRVLRQGQECYLFVLLTKKPSILEFWECEEYEFKGGNP